MQGHVEFRGQFVGISCLFSLWLSQNQPQEVRPERKVSAFVPSAYEVWFILHLEP